MAPRTHLRRTVKLRHIDRAVAEWLDQSKQRSDISEVIAEGTRRSHEIHGSLLLLNPGAHAEYQDAIESATNQTLKPLYTLIARHSNITHVAMLQHISPVTDTDDLQGGGENSKRSTKSLKLLYGDFGPSACKHPPDIYDFRGTYWVVLTLPTFHMIWAPRWTFCHPARLKERTKILQSSLELDEANLHSSEQGAISAVDLNGTLGSSAFSFLGTGVSRVLLWERDPWKVESIARGAAKNHFTIRRNLEPVFGDIRLWVFTEDNTMAPKFLQQAKDHFPPIRYVTCSIQSNMRRTLEVATQVLDVYSGGWIFVLSDHETCDGIEQLAEQTKQQIKIYTEKRRTDDERTSWACNLLRINPSRGFTGLSSVVFTISVLPWTPSTSLH